MTALNSRYVSLESPKRALNDRLKNQLVRNCGCASDMYLNFEALKKTINFNRATSTATSDMLI